jgi:hypothetical protein
MRSTVTRVKHLLRLVPLSLVVVVLVLSDSRPAAATSRCFVGLRDCYVSAALYAEWIDMWLNGLDCEVDFIDCFRRAMIGR